MPYLPLGNMYNSQRLGSFEAVTGHPSGFAGIFDEMARVTGYKKHSKEKQRAAERADAQRRADESAADAQFRADEAQARELSAKKDSLTYQRKMKEREMALAEKKIAQETKRLASAAAHKREIEASQVRLEQERISAQTSAAKHAASAETTKTVVIVAGVVGTLLTVAILMMKK